MFCFNCRQVLSSDGCAKLLGNNGVLMNVLTRPRSRVFLGSGPLEWAPSKSQGGSLITNFCVTTSRSNGIVQLAFLVLFCLFFYKFIDLLYFLFRANPIFILPPLCLDKCFLFSRPIIFHQLQLRMMVEKIKHLQNIHKKTSVSFLL